MSSATESEKGALFENTKIGTLLQLNLEDMGNPQPDTLVQTNNSGSTFIINHHIQQKHWGRWICASIGEDIWLVKNTSVFFGYQGVKIRVIILQNILPLNIIFKWDQYSLLTQYQKWKVSFWEGVLILFTRKYTKNTWNTIWGRMRPNPYSGLYLWRSRTTTNWQKYHSHFISLSFLTTTLIWTT